MGPLRGLKVIELAGIGPAPMACMILADMGAEVVRIERGKTRPSTHKHDVSNRGKKSLVLDLKADKGKEILFELVAGADVLVEGFRPGVMEKLGFSPEACFAKNKKLIYGRMTGWGQTGPLAHTAGHDINYIAITGALHAVGRQGEKPVVPLNLFGDMGGGGMLLVSGILAALYESQTSEEGQVIDASMVDGAAQLMWMMHGFHANGRWNAEDRGSNLLDGAAHFYDTYETSDQRYIALGAIEPQFYRELIERAGFDAAEFSGEKQIDKSQWSEQKTRFAELFRQKTQEEWCDILEGTDACFSPVLNFLEAPGHEHNQARSTYIEVDGFMQPAPAPRFSRTESRVAHGQHDLGQDSALVLADFGYSEAEIEALRESGVIS